MSLRQAVILAGGLGTRLRASAGDLPKPLVPVHGKPFIRWLVELVRDRGMQEVLLLTGYRAEPIHDHFERDPVDGIELRYSREPAPLGTGGALRHAVPLLDSLFVLINGDTYLDVAYAELLQHATRQDTAAMMVIYRDANGELDQKGNVDVDEDGFVVAYQSKPAPPLPYIDAGVSVWSRQLFERLSPAGGAFSLERDVVPELIARRQLWSSSSPRRFYDIGTPERLAIFETAIVAS